MRTLIAALGLSLLVSGCSEPEDNSPPVAKVTFSASKQRAAVDTPVDFTYSFEVLPNAPAINGDYFVFVHVLTEDGELMWTDDHLPAVPTSQWKPGQTVGPYTRTRFLPKFDYSGPASVVLGLYKRGDDKRLKLTGAFLDEARAKKQEYKVATFDVSSTSTEDLLLVRKDGWYEEDSDPNDPLSRSRWTQKTAAVTVRNPRKDVTLLLDSSAQKELFPEPQVVTIAVNGQPVTTFEATNQEPLLRRIPITAAQLGAGDVAEIRLTVDRSFIPAKVMPGSRDIRELGLRVYHLYVENK